MIRIFRQYISPRKTIFVLGEGLLIFLAITLASYVILGWDIGLKGMLEMIWVKVLLISLMTQLSLYFYDLYEFKKADTTIDIATRLIQSFGVTTIILAITYYVLPDMIIGRWVFFGSLILLLFFISLWRLLYNTAVARQYFVERAIIIGAGNLARDLLNEIKARKDLSYDIRYILTQKDEPNDLFQFEKIKMRVGFNDICLSAEEENVKTIIVALDEKRGVFPYQELLDCKVRGISIIDGESFYERISGKLLIERINPSLLIFSDGFVKSKTTRFLKRTVGLILSIFMLIVLLPLLLIVSIAIKLDSKGTIFFSQDRVGEFGKIFKLYKCKKS